MGDPVGAAPASAIVSARGAGLRLPRGAVVPGVGILGPEPAHPGCSPGIFFAAVSAPHPGIAMSALAPDRDEGGELGGEPVLLRGELTAAARQHACQAGDRCLQASDARPPATLAAQLSCAPIGTGGPRAGLINRQSPSGPPPPPTSSSVRTPSSEPSPRSTRAATRGRSSYVTSRRVGQGHEPRPVRPHLIPMSSVGWSFPYHPVTGDPLRADTDGSRLNARGGNKAPRRTCRLLFPLAQPVGSACKQHTLSPLRQACAGAR
jgi:hypothetical protein